MEFSIVSHERQQETLEEFVRMSNPHIEASAGRLALLERNPDKYPAQDLSRYEIEGDTQSAAVVEGIAQIAESRFPALMNYLDTQEKEHGTVTHIGEVLKSGGNVLLVTNHGELIDVALALAAVYSALDKKQYEFKSGIVISKMVSLLGYKLGEEAAPAAEVLKLVCDDIFLSFPRTDSVRKSKILSFLPNHVDSYNRKLREAVEDKLDRGGMLFAMAASGTTDKPMSSDSNTISLSSVGYGSMAWMKGRHRLVVPTAIWLQEQEPVFEFCGYPRVVDSDQAGHQVMHDIADTLSQRIEGKTFVYSGDSLGKTAVRSANRQEQ